MVWNKNYSLSLPYRGRMPKLVIKGEHLLVEGGAIRLTVVGIKP